MIASDRAYAPRLAASLASSADKILCAHVLDLQSKRLLLAAAERRLAKTSDRRVHEWAMRLRREVYAARKDYLAAVLIFGTPDTAQYQLAAYVSLLEVGERLAVKLRTAARELPPPICFEVWIDIEQLDQVLQRWRAAIRTSMRAIASS